jgi:hypothetical protein
LIKAFGLVQFAQSLSLSLRIKEPGMRRILLFLLLVAASCTKVTAQFSISGQQPLCFDSCNGSARVTGPIGHNYHYLWSTGDTVAVVSNLCAGSYACTISDTLGAALDTLAVTIQQPGALVITPSVLKNETCYADTDGYVKFNATGGTGTRYSFNWSTG